MGARTSLPPGFSRLAWSNLAAQSADQVALAAAPRAAIGLCCANAGVREMVGVDVRVAVCTRCARVTLDMRLCTAVHVCRLVERLETCLPGDITPWIVMIDPFIVSEAASLHREGVAVL